MEIRFDLKPDGGVERGYEIAHRLRSPIDSIHAQVEDNVLRVVLNEPDLVDINALVQRVEDAITPDPEGLEWSDRIKG